MIFTSHNSIKILLLFSLISFSFFTFSQSYTKDIVWKNSQTSEVNVVYIENGSHENKMPQFSFTEKLKNKYYSIDITSIVSKPIGAEDQVYISEHRLSIPTEETIKGEIKEAGTEVYAVLSGSGYITKNNQLYKVTSISYQLNQVSTLPLAVKKDYLANSILASGQWYKIAVSSDGLYRIDKSFLESMGVDIANFNPKHLNVYGNADGMLGEKNADTYLDDLQKNPIFAIGESDNILNDGDYFAFYGKGPHEWSFSNTQGFSRQMHIYSDVNHYFIHIDGTDAPLRIQSVANETGTVTDVATTFEHRAIIENDLTNLVSGGQRFYGELYDFTLTHSYNFNIPNVVPTDSIRVKTAYAYKASNPGNNFNISRGGVTLKSDALGSGSVSFIRTSQNFYIKNPTSSLALTATFNRSSPSNILYFDFMTIQVARNLVYTGSNFDFRNTESIGAGKMTEFVVSNINPNTVILDITKPWNPFQLQGTISGSTLRFIQKTDTLREFVAVELANAINPTFIKVLENQNLHGLTQKDYLIISHPDFLEQAQRLANLHTSLGLSVQVVSLPLIYNEFSSGNQDATAIRRFTKMFYDRAGLDPSLRPKYLLLFGDATFDPKNRVPDNNYMVPSYQDPISEDIISALVTDDYFGFMNNNEGFSGTDMLDIGVGRLLATTYQQSVELVNKIESYISNQSLTENGNANSCCTEFSTSTFGDWRNNYTLITDDEENNYFTKYDAEPASSKVTLNNPEMNVEKIYSDAFTQISTAGGERYPEVNNSITNRINRGTLVVNYVGHGGEVGLAQERIVTIPMLNELSNSNRLSLFVTATCEFCRFDDPARVSAGELVCLNPLNGAIAAMTTSRSVFFSVNTGTVQELYDHMFSRNAQGKPLTFGEIMMKTKNLSGSTSQNRRSFNLIGDPALRINLPRERLVVDSINGIEIGLVGDTAKALSKVRISGHVEYYTGGVISGFNGIIAPVIYDKPKTNFTLANDPESSVQAFKTQKNAIYKGKASVKNGYYSFEFYVPKDIDYSFGKGKISLYADNATFDANGWDTSIVVGGIDPNGIVDLSEPDIQIFMNNSSFVNGGITGKTPLLIAEINDNYGINTVGNGIGHDITAILDGETSKPIVLNDFYQGNLDDFTSGRIEYEFGELALGPHTIELKVWDINNNSSTSTLNFIVQEDSSAVISRVYNYPNPFTTNTKFIYEHNQSCSMLETQVQIFTVSGKLVKTINELVPTNGFRAEGMNWDGKDDFGDQLAKGVYVYRLKVSLPDGSSSEKTEKLVILR